MRLSMYKIDIMMARNKMTVTNLAKRYGVSRTRMNAILKQREVTPICAGRIAEALDTDVTEIITD